MNIESLTITRHAFYQFYSRCPNEYLESNETFDEALREIMLDASEEDLGAIVPLRLMRNGFKDARYFRSGIWRIVTDIHCRAVLTIEIATCKPNKYKHLGRIYRPRTRKGRSYDKKDKF